MAHRNHHDVQATESGVIHVYGSFVGANGANGTSPKGCVVSATRAGEGDWDLVLRDAYPSTDHIGESTVMFADAVVVGAIGDKAEVSAFDPEAKTATVVTWLKDGTADDVDGKTVRIRFEVRNTTARRG
jgi:hypothetical protein